MAISFRSTIFLLFLVVSIVPLLTFSFITFNITNDKIEFLLEQDLLAKAEQSTSLYAEHQNSLLSSGLEFSKNQLVLDAIENRNYDDVQQVLSTIQQVEEADIVLLTDQTGAVLVRANSNASGDTSSISGFVQGTMQRGTPAVSTEIIPVQELIKEGSEFYVAAQIRRIPSVFQRDIPETHLQDAIATVSVVPIRKNNAVIGSIVIADILNQDSTIPDKLKQSTNLEFSIFQDDVRVATTLATKNNNRFIGTLLPNVVYEKAVVDASPFFGRVLGTNAWQRAAYLPLKNHRGHAIGAFEVSIPEQDFLNSDFFLSNQDISRTMLFFLAIIAVITLTISLLISFAIARPLNAIIASSREAAKGNLTQGVQISTFKEFEQLAKHFNIMIRTIRDRYKKK